MNQEHLGELDLNKLVALSTLLELRSVSGAARQLDMPQPTLSHLLKQLRTAFADSLLVRTGNTMTLTPRGEALREPIGRAIASLQELGQSEEFAPEKAQTTFHIACTDFVAGALLPGVIKRLRKEAPGIRLVLENWGTRRTDSLGDDGLDLGIGTLARAEGGIYQRLLFEDDFVCIAAKNNRCAHQKLSPEEFARLPHMRLSVKGSGGGVVDTALEQLGLRREIALSLTHFWLAGDFLRDTDLLLTAPRRLYNTLASRSSCLKLVKLPIVVPPLKFHIFWHERVHSDPAHTYVRQCIQAEATKLH